MKRKGEGRKSKDREGKRKGVGGGIREVKEREGVR